jgi:hypothetical protein
MSNYFVLFQKINILWKSLFVFTSYRKNVRLKTVEKENNLKVYYYVLKGCKRASANKNLKVARAHKEVFSVLQNFLQSWKQN